MENNIQAGSIGQNFVHEIKNDTKDKEELKSKLEDTIKSEVLDSFSTSIALEKKDRLDSNISKGFVETAKASIRNIDDGIAKLHDLDAAFNSLEATYGSRIELLNTASEIVKDVQDTLKNTKFNNQFIAASTNHGIGSNQITIASDEKERKEINSIERIDQAIEALTENKAKIQEKIDILNDFIQREEIFVTPQDEVKITNKDAMTVQENLINQNTLFSMSHKLANEKIASLFL